MADSLHASVSSMPVRSNGSAWDPLREPLFRSLWLAAVISYTGTWMQNVGAGWLMTQLTLSPFMVGLVQAATTLPVFLVILPAGALADMVDRRRFLLITQAWMVAAAGLLGIFTLLGYVTPWILLLFTFVLGLGAVMNDPAWQAITPDIVCRENHAPAVALNSVGFNVARAIGPALGGLCARTLRVNSHGSIQHRRQFSVSAAADHCQALSVWGYRLRVAPRFLRLGRSRRGHGASTIADPALRGWRGCGIHNSVCIHDVRSWSRPRVPVAESGTVRKRRRLDSNFGVLECCGPDHVSALDARTGAVHVPAGFTRRNGIGQRGLGSSGDKSWRPDYNALFRRCTAFGFSYSAAL